MDLFPKHVLPTSTIVLKWQRAKLLDAFHLFTPSTKVDIEPNILGKLLGYIRNVRKHKYKI